LNPFNVKVGQIWEDTDARYSMSRPQKKVISISENYANCLSYYDCNPNRVIHVNINLCRFNECAGYKLVKDI
jgi:hypothetical protein